MCVGMIIDVNVSKEKIAKLLLNVIRTSESKSVSERKGR